MNAFESESEFTHTAFGLRYRSRMDWLPLHRVSNEAPYDVDLSYGALPPALETNSVSTARYDAQPNQLLFKTNYVANFLVEHGKAVCIEPKTNAEPLKICNLLFGAITGALLIQRGTIALHGCSIETPHGAVLFCGDSGAGKSTLAGLLMQRGFRVLDDNIAALKYVDNDWYVQPGLGHLRFTPETLNIIGLQPNGPPFGAPVKLKYQHFLSREQFCSDAKPLRHIFVLNRAAQEMLQTLNGKEKLIALQRYTFVEHMLKGLGQLPQHFRQWAKLACTVPVSLLGHPPSQNTQQWVEEIAAILSNS